MHGHEGDVANILFEIRLPFRMKKKAAMVISSCPVLDLYAQGSTEKEAKKNLTDAARLFFLTCYENGVWDAIFRELGFKITRAPVRRPKESYITVPLSFTTAERSSSNAAHQPPALESR